MVDLVVARYNEDVEWTKNIHFPVFLYNKGEDLVVPNIKLPNIGREAHTILFHICENYNTLNEFTLFLQGNPFDHCPSVLDSFSKIEGRIIDGILLNDGCYGYGRKVTEKFSAYPNSLFADILFQKIFHNICEEFVFVAGAQLLVHVENIRKNSLNFYRYCLKHITNYQEKSGFDAWSFERVWPCIFNKNFLFKNKIDETRLIL